ncbi:MAG: helix-turn-helix transcriptional regulator [Pseudomonadota bacterium]
MKNNIANMPNEIDLDVEGLASTYPAGAHIERHRHATHQVAHAVSGVLRVLARDAAWIVPPGRALWIPAETEHEIRCGGPVEMRTVYIRGARPAFPDRLQVIGVSPLLREILVRFAEGCRPEQAAALTALLATELADMRVQPLSLPLPHDRNLARVSLALLQDPADQRSLQDWARELGYAPRSLIRHIRSQTGLTFRELRRQARVLAAIERLAGGAPVTTVAFDVGFSSPSAFTYAFRSVTGTTPRAYMR